MPKVGAGGALLPAGTGIRRRLVPVAAVAVAAALLLTRGYWLRALGDSLVCPASLAISDAIVIENVEDNYRLFEHAQRLQNRGLSGTVLVPVLTADHGDAAPEVVSRGVTDLMCRTAQIRNCMTFDAVLDEPISLNVAKRTAEELRARGASSAIVITDGFRSRRVSETYRSVFGAAGLTVHIQPVFGRIRPDNWHTSWHGIQDVGLQVLKLWYYRLVVL